VSKAAGRVRRVPATAAAAVMSAAVMSAAVMSAAVMSAAVMSAAVMSTAVMSAAVVAPKDHTTNNRTGGTNHGARCEFGRTHVGPGRMRWLHDHGRWRHVRASDRLCAGILVQWLSHRHWSVSASFVLLPLRDAEQRKQYQHKYHCDATATLSSVLHVVHPTVACKGGMSAEVVLAA